MVAQWVRAARGDSVHRNTALRYAGGIAFVQVLWVGLLLVPDRLVVAGFLLFSIIELLIPAWAEQSGMTPWHPHHIAERYGLMTIIVLGESMLAATLAAQEAIASGPAMVDLAPLIVGGLLIVFTMWWLYFDRSPEGLLTSLRRAITWGYAHYLVFAAAAAVGAGLAVALDHETGKAQLSARVAGAAVAVPVALYLAVLWRLHGTRGRVTSPYIGPAAIVLVLVTPFTDHAVPLTGLILVTLLAVKLWARARALGNAST
jgi:low temperature requirement protein LtrA